MLVRGRKGEPLWNPEHPAKIVKLTKWLTIYGQEDQAEAYAKDYPGSDNVPVAGNCRLCTLKDAIADLGKEGIKLTKEQLVVPYRDVSSILNTPMEVLQYQSTDNGIGKQRIDVRPQELLNIAVEAMKNAMSFEKKALTNVFGFTREYQQRLQYAARAWEYMPSLLTRMKDAPVDKKACGKIEYSENCPVPISRFPYNKVNRLWLDIQEAKKKDLTKAATLRESFVADVELLLSEVMAKGGSGKAKTLGVDSWKAAATPTIEGSVTRLLHSCVEANTLLEANKQIGDILAASVNDAFRWFKAGRDAELLENYRIAMTLTEEDRIAAAAELQSVGIDVPEPIVAAAKTIAKKAPTKKAPTKKQNA